MVSDKYSQNALAHPVIPLVDIKTVDPQARGPTTFLRRRQPWVVWLFTLGQVIALVVELIINHQLTGSVIQTSPFNYMIGPSTATLIYTGARFVPCMRPGPYSNQPAPCLQDGGIYSTNTTCTWEQLCGFDGFKPDGTPDQGFRFVLPIFLHAGVLHLLFNLLHQLSYGSQLEREIGWWRFGAIYILSGIGGIILGSILSPPLFASVGASGALFGLLACQLLEILFNWHRIHNPCLELSKFVIVIGLSFVLGLLPGIDNFAHIGGFIAGLFAGLIFLSNLPFDKYTKWIRLVAWVISVAVIITLFTTGLVTFYDKDDLTNICPWCKNLTCAAIFDSCKAMYN
ncbi:rhomboid family-domain-containing protein [Dimargaris cristalligena]|uniref:Rhomboid-type serine protease n=1 Tax=Dimargaris cristalligena TaxID=215637 RepID=A0A4P9ZKZ3_9FUNG|nr:rhomboid family-domain-containing protein [Dimargaris cristalligena]|eukprot:RKP33927.1 rhomboid family-domain-containing protein [Dimargaris cristalligena]